MVTDCAFRTPHFRRVSKFDESLCRDSGAVPSKRRAEPVRSADVNCRREAKILK
jgi:hypothetical protein